MSTTGQHDDAQRPTGPAPVSGSDGRGSGGRGRIALAVVALWLPAIAILLSWSAWSNQLPKTLPIHWSGTGTPDGFGATDSIFITTLCFAVGAAVVGTLCAYLPVVRPLLRRGILGFAGLVGGVAASAWILSGWLTIQAGGDPEQAVLGAWVILPLLGTAWGVVPWVLHPKTAVAARSGNGLRPIPLASTETGAWSRTSTGVAFIWVAIGFVVLTGGLTIPLVLNEGVNGIFPGVVMLIATLLIVSFIRIRVTVDRRGLRVVSTTLGIPFKRIPLHEIDAVQTEELVPMQWGGWGYRVMPGRSAVVLHGGEGIVVTRSNGTLFAVSIPDAATGASLLEALRERERAERN